ncbi:hypothetical protein ACJX0J_031398 [Zea mays]
MSCIAKSWAGLTALGLSVCRLGNIDFNGSSNGARIISLSHTFWASPIFIFDPPIFDIYLFHFKPTTYLRLLVEHPHLMEIEGTFGPIVLATHTPHICHLRALK